MVTRRVGISLPMLWLARIALAAANVERQFQVLPGLQSPAYALKVLDTSSEDAEFRGYADSMLSNGSTGRLLTINDFDRTVSCILPPPTSNKDEVHAPLLPLSDESVLDAARKVLVSSLEDEALSFVNEVWYWQLQFEKAVFQVLPHYINLEPDFSNLVFRIVVGRPANQPGQSLASAQPVVIDDKHMLRVDYPAGDLCALTGEPREVRMFFTCDAEDVADEISVLSIDEPYACIYEFVIGIPELCEIPELREKNTPPTSIVCAYDKVESDIVEEQEINEEPRETYVKEEEYTGATTEPAEIIESETEQETVPEPDSEDQLGPEAINQVLEQPGPEHNEL